MDQFYALATGQDDAFYQMCMVLPGIIQKAVLTLESTSIPKDTVLEEIRSIAAKQNSKSEDLAIAMAVYVLGFGTYKGLEESGLKTKY